MHYTKNFQDWSQVKQSIQKRSDNPPRYKEREIWLAQLGVNIGDEEDGKGPSFSRYLVWIVPLTSNPRSGKYYYPVMVDGKISAVILSQLRVLDARRFTDRIGVLDEVSFQRLKKKFVSLIS